MAGDFPKYLEVTIRLDRRDGFYVATASVRPWSFYDDATTILHTGECQSRDEKNAVAYALTELSVMLTRMKELPRG